MTFNSRPSYYNNNIFNRNSLLSEKREKMYEYSNNLYKRNLGINRPNSKFSYKHKEQVNNTNFNSIPLKENKDNITYDKFSKNFYNNSYKNNLNSFLKDNNLNLLNYGSKYENSKGKNYKNELNYIQDYIPNIRNIDLSNFNSKKKDEFFQKKLKELDKIDKEIKPKLGNNNDINNRNDIDKYSRDELIKKYFDEKNENKKYDLFNYKYKLNNNNNEQNKQENTKMNINDNIKKNEDKNEIELATKDDYLENEDKQKSITHHKPNINRSRSVAPNKNIITSEISKITNSLNGFNNLGSTCYMNSALQNIIHCKIFIDKIIVIKNSNLLNSKNNSITKSFLDLCYALIDIKARETSRYSSYTYSLNSISPSNFKSNFCLKHKAYMRGQHDSIEFLRTLLDDMSKEININQNISAYKELTTEGKSKEEQNKEYHNFFLSRENSIIVDIFYNQIINIFTCACGFESYSFQKLLDIPLLLPNKEYKIDLLSLINEYFKEEEIDWSTKCEECKKPELKHLKMIKFSILNEIVIFSLQRFDPFLSTKNDIRVSFKETIDLKDFCDDDLFKENTKYRLCGTINHIGNINYGHYYSFIRIGEIWYEFNDSIVRKVYSMDYDNSSVCVLFYEKI